MIGRCVHSASRRRLALAATAGVLALFAAPAAAQDAPDVGPDPAPIPSATTGDELPQIETRLAERYDRLEQLVGRLAELSQSTQPRRAALLRQLISQSRERDVPGKFEGIVAALEKESYSAALDGQSELHGELQKLLELLLQEDRDRQIESERKRIGRYLQDLNKLIRLQRGVKARTDGGDEEQKLADDQQRVGDQTKKLGDEIEDTEGVAEAKAKRAEAAAPSEQPSAGDNGKQGDPQEGDRGKPSESGEESDGENQPAEAGEPKGDAPKEPEPSAGEDAKPAEAGEPKPGEEPSQGKPNESQPAEGQPSQSKPSEGQPSERQPAPGQPSRSPPSDGQPGQPSESEPSAEQSQPPQEQPASPMEKAAERLQQAQQRMEEAKKQLEESKREGATAEQEKAVEQLEQAKAELERILRQLREEELERMLVMLEARFRQMLDAQIEVYDETKRLDAAADKMEPHELEIAGGRQSRKERLIVREADRALVLLREDGTSVAFPEAVEQARGDMESIANRLAETKVDLITQGLEEDVIAALEETLAALQQAIKDLRQQRGQQQPPQGGQSEPGEQPLVDQLAELRMIRSLQVRVNRRTEQYGAMIDGEQALKAELVDGLSELALRQQKIFQATQDLDREANQ